MSTARPRRSEQTSTARWVPLALAVAAVVLLLVAANVQLWRATDRLSHRDVAAKSEPLPPLPKTSGNGNEALLREMDRIERSFGRSVSEMQAQITRSTSAAPSSISSPLATLAVQSRRLTPELQRLNGFQASLSGTAPVVNKIPAQLREMNGRLADIRRLDRSLKQLSQQLGAHGSLQGNVDSLNSRADGLITRADSFSTQISGLDGNLGNLQTGLGGLTGEMSTLQSMLRDLNGNIGSMSGTMVGLTGLIERNNQLLQRFIDILCSQVTTACEPQPPAPTP